MIRDVLKEIGGLCALLGGALLLPAAVACLYREWYTALALVIGALFAAGAGLGLYHAFKHSVEMERHHAFMAAALGWLAIAFFGAIPYLLAAYLTPDAVALSYVPQGADYPPSLWNFRNPLHAFFESMSGFTTTGLTMSTHEPSVGKGLRFYRSLSQWLGGAGFIVMALAVLPRPAGQDTLLLFSSESARSKLRPSIVGTARAIWKVYLGLTLFTAVYLFVGMSLLLPDYGWRETLFDAINHALTGQSTGGFSTQDGSIGSYGSASVEALYLLPMIMGAISLALYYRVLATREPRRFWRDSQTRVLLGGVVVGTLLLALLIAPSADSAFPLREALFNFTSAWTTTGWQTAEVSEWPAGAVMFIVFFAMIVGGASGSTVGAIKLERVLILLSGLRWRVANLFKPDSAVKVLESNGQRMVGETAHRHLAEAASFASLFLLLLFASAVVTTHFSGDSFSLAETIFEAASALGGVGLSSGLTGPDMHPVVETLFIVEMWAGRLEILPILVLVRALFK